MAQVSGDSLNPNGTNIDSVILENADEIIDQMILINNAEQEQNNKINSGGTMKNLQKKGHKGGAVK
jgi:hypothetical protein